MSEKRRRRELHPMLRYGEAKGWDRRKTASHFGFDPETAAFRQVVNGHVGASLERAQEWAGRSEGYFSAMDVLLWHQRVREERAA